MTLPTQSLVLTGASIYGAPWSRGDRSRSSAAWEAKCLAPLTPPFRMTYADKPVRALHLHRFCHPHVMAFLNLIHEAAKGKQETLDLWGVSLYGGGYNYRLMRGGRALSMHSFGCAIDLDPVRNGLHDRTPRFLEFPELVKAIRQSGVCWGADWNGDGRTADTRTMDGMHFQWTAPL